MTSLRWTVLLLVFLAATVFAEEQSALVKEVRERILAAGKAKNVEEGWKLVAALEEKLKAEQLADDDKRSVERSLKAFRRSLVQMEIEAAPLEDGAKLA